MDTKQRAITILDALSDKELEMFIYLFGDKHHNASVYPELDLDEQAVYKKLSRALDGFDEDFLADGRPDFAPSMRDEL